MDHKGLNEANTKLHHTVANDLRISEMNIIGYSLPTSEATPLTSLKAAEDITLRRGTLLFANAHESIFDGEDNVLVDN